MAESNAETAEVAVDGNGNGNGGSGGDIQTPAEKLQELQNKLAQQQADLADLTQANNTCKADEATLRKLVTELNKAVSDYETSLPGFLDQQDNFKSYADTKGQMIAAAIEDKREEILRIRSTCQSQLDTLKQEASQRKKKMDDAKSSYDQAKQFLAQKIKIFEDFRQLKKTVEDNFKTMKNLKTSIEAVECENKFAVMYYLFQELHQLRGDTNVRIMPVDTFREELNKNWNAMDEALTDSRDKEDMWLTAKTAYESKKSELEQFEAGFRDKVITELAKIEF